LKKQSVRLPEDFTTLKKAMKMIYFILNRFDDSIILLKEFTGGKNMHGKKKLLRAVQCHATGRHA
jgi:hypothetical protein